MKKLLVFVAFIVAATASTYAQMTSFFELVKTGTTKDIQAAISKGADIKARDEDGMTPLMYAAMFNFDSGAIITLLKAGADISAKDWKYGTTSLMFAAMFNPNPKVITTLLNRGADIKALNNDGMTPLMHAAGSNLNPDVIVTLLNAGADTKAKDSNGRTAFDWAQGNKKLIGTDAYWKLREARH